MKKQLFSGFVALCLAAVMTSCAKAPQADIDAATVAVSQCDSLGGAQYAPEKFNAAQDSLKAALANVETQKSKMFGNFDVVKTQLAYVLTLTTEIKTDIETRKAELTAEINLLLTQTDSVLIENKTLITKAPKGKEGKAALEAMQVELTAIEAEIVATKELLAKGELVAADNKIKAANEKANGIKQELTDAIAKKGKK